MNFDLAGRYESLFLCYHLELFGILGQQVIHIYVNAFHFLVLRFGGKLNGMKGFIFPKTFNLLQSSNFLKNAQNQFFEILESNDCMLQALHNCCLISRARFLPSHCFSCTFV